MTVTPEITVSRTPADASAGNRPDARRTWTGLAAVGSLALTAIAYFALGARTPVLLGVEAALLTALFVAPRVRRSTAARENPRVSVKPRPGKGRPAFADLVDAAGPGWHVLSDISLGRGNIGHVLVGPGGGFVVGVMEGGGLDRKQIVFAESLMLDQVDADRRQLERVTGLEFEALLAVTDSWLVGSPHDYGGSVILLPARLLANHLRGRQAKLDSAEAAEIAETLRLALEVDALQAPAGRESDAATGLPQRVQRA